jgi:hypothetical protein
MRPLRWLTRRREDAKRAGAVGRSLGEDVAGEIGPGGFQPVESGDFLIGDDGYLGGFEALRLARFAFRGVFGFWRIDRMAVFV